MMGMHEILEADLMEEWEGKVVLRTLDEVPVCPACGIDESDVGWVSCEALETWQGSYSERIFENSVPSAYACQLGNPLATLRPNPGFSSLWFWMARYNRFLTSMWWNRAALDVNEVFGERKLPFIWRAKHGFLIINPSDASHDQRSKPKDGAQTGREATSNLFVSRFLSCIFLSFGFLLSIDSFTLLAFAPNHLPSSMPPLELPELQPEIWAHIISFLQNELPPPGTASNWSELHQSDLATVMRVNTVSLIALRDSLSRGYHLIKKLTDVLPSRRSAAVL